MRQLEIKLPNTISDCTPEQMTRWLMMADAMKDNKDDITQFLIFQCQLLSLFSGESINKIKRADVDSIQEASTHMLKLLTSYHYQEPKSANKAKKGSAGGKQSKQNQGNATAKKAKNGGKKK